MRDFYRRKLQSILETADDEGFIQLLWAANALQSGAPDAAMRFLEAESVPREAITEDITQRLFIYKWELETLTNELLTTPKKFKRRGELIKQLNTSNYANILRSANYLRKLENVESRKHVKEQNIFMELARIANRQFPWQRGYLNISQFYRNAYIYGQGVCANYFEERYGIRMDQLSLIGFSLYTALNNQPLISKSYDLTSIGVNQEHLSRALSLISNPILDAKKTARSVRQGIYHTAYRPSILRQRPCLSFGVENDRVRAPLPQLIVERVTSGVFYDLVSGGGAVRAEYGKHFQYYCFTYLQSTLANLEWREETSYRVKPNIIDTPDILCKQEDSIIFAVECKASRMSYGARFSDNPLDDRGFDDMIKAVYQIWRFFSHCRRNISGFALKESTIGVVLTLDGWLTMAEPLRDYVIDSAVEMAAQKDSQILEQDRRPIVFVSIADLELTLARATERTFVEAVQATANPPYKGWTLSSVHDHFVDPNVPERAYPFKKDIGRLLPWCDRIEANAQKQRG